MGRLIVVTTPRAATGFRMAGAATEVAGSPEEADRVIRELLDGGETGVIAVDEELLAGVPPERRRWLEDLVNPVIVAIPAVTAGAPAGGRRARLAEMLRRAIGYRITFGEEG